MSSKSSFRNLGRHHLNFASGCSCAWITVLTWIPWHCFNSHALSFLCLLPSLQSLLLVALQENWPFFSPHCSPAILLRISFTLLLTLWSTQKFWKKHFSLLLSYKYNQTHLDDDDDDDVRLKCSREVLL